ncbi:unnamed protein product [Cuscuta europaea]|uniref:Uncharacterized protein n=1 Tax=Cuscuta europaea TaxID=41803 RepID=A0A9P0ZPN8_CUSEU|nr:unnamed protein product [Cuscuta europaea]
MHGTLSPREFLRGATPPTDKSVMSRQADDALCSKVLHASITASIGLGELIRRMEESTLQKQKADESLVLARKQLQDAQEAFRLEREAFDKIFENSKVVARAEAEKVAAEAAGAAGERAEEAKKKAVTQAEKVVVAAFVTEGWKTEEHQQWVASMVEASWITG